MHFKQLYDPEQAVAQGYSEKTSSGLSKRRSIKVSPLILSAHLALQIKRDEPVLHTEKNTPEAGCCAHLSHICGALW